MGLWRGQPAGRMMAEQQVSGGALPRTSTVSDWDVVAGRGQQQRQARVQVQAQAEQQAQAQTWGRGKGRRVRSGDQLF